MGGCWCPTGTQPYQAHPCSPQELSPASQTARFEDLEVYRVGGGPRAPSSALPIGERGAEHGWRLALCWWLLYEACWAAAGPAGLADAAAFTNLAKHAMLAGTHLLKTPPCAPCPPPTAGATSVADPLKLTRVTNPQVGGAAAAAAGTASAGAGLPCGQPPHPCFCPGSMLALLS